MQAYGWSVPAKCSTSVHRDSQTTKTKSQMPVPVPVYCRPMSDVDAKMKACNLSVLVEKALEFK